MRRVPEIKAVISLRMVDNRDADRHELCVELVRGGRTYRGERIINGEDLRDMRQAEACVIEEFAGAFYDALGHLASDSKIMMEAPRPMLEVRNNTGPVRLEQSHDNVIDLQPGEWVSLK